MIPSSARHIKIQLFIQLVFILCLNITMLAQPEKIGKLEHKTGEVALELPPQKISAAVCSSEKMDEIRARATTTNQAVRVNCSFTLNQSDVITKRLIIEGDAEGMECDCNGATLKSGNKGRVNYNAEMIQIRSKKEEDTWVRPKNVLIKNCNIIGAVRVWGMGRNGEDANVKESSRREPRDSQHVKRLRDSAPTNIVFDNITITGVKRNPFYFGPGVTHSKLINSEIKGKSSKVGIYLDAESAYNTIKNNKLHVSTAKDGAGKWPGVKSRGWPQMAIDGSSHNKIIGNRMSGLNNGGIYLYRNCGEGGTIRHTPPEHNIIINNSFYYKKYKGNKPAIYLGSRDYGWKENLGDEIWIWGEYCASDEGRPYGSSKSDKDYARHNVVMQNQLFKRKIYKRAATNQTIVVPATIQDMIVTQNRDLNSPNYVKFNELVSERIARKSGCYLENGYKDFFVHGESTDIKIRQGRLRCSEFQVTCNDGEWEYTRTNCTITEVPFDCQIEGSNRGCSKTISCPSGQKIIGAKVACNLEYGTVDNSVLAAVPDNQIKIVRTSDDTSDGYCYIGSNKLSKGSTTIEDIVDELNAVIGCKEKDKNGGDCHIRGVLYCR